MPLSSQCIFYIIYFIFDIKCNFEDSNSPMFNGQQLNRYYCHKSENPVKFVTTFQPNSEI